MDGAIASLHLFMHSGFGQGQLYRYIFIHISVIMHGDRLLGARNLSNYYSHFEISYKSRLDSHGLRTYLYPSNGGNWTGVTQSV